MQAYLKRVPVSGLGRCREDAEFTKTYLLSVQPNTETINIKESWDGLHFLLSPRRRKPSNIWDTSVVWNNIDLMGIALIGKETLNKDCKLGFGSPKYVSPEQVQEIAKLLKNLRWDQVEENYQPDLMVQCGVYPEDFWEEEEKGRNFLKYWFAQLCRFYQKAAASGQAVICYLKI